jgi:hypothetical protein
VLNSRLTEHPRGRQLCVSACGAVGASAIHVRCMDKLTEDAVQEIEQIHSSWIEFEVAGEDETCWRCALMISSCGRLTRSLCSDAWRFRRSWRTGLQEFTALRFPIVGFEVQTRLLT